MAFYRQCPPTKYFEIRGALYPQVWEGKDHSIGRYRVAHLKRPDLKLPAGRTVIFARPDEAQRFTGRGIRELAPIQAPGGEIWFHVFETNGDGENAIGEPFSGTPAGKATDH